MICICQTARAQFGIVAGARRHAEHSAFKELPFADGDMSYTVGCEYHDLSGYWQFIVGYAPDVGTNTTPNAAGVSNKVDYVLTPQLNMLVVDGIWIGGMGVMASQVKTELTDDWTDIYWQFMFGIEIATPIIRLEILAYYPFENWGELSEFDFGDIDYGGALKIVF